MYLQILVDFTLNPPSNFCLREIDVFTWLAPADQHRELEEINHWIGFINEHAIDA